LVKSVRPAVKLSILIAGPDEGVAAVVPAVDEGLDGMAITPQHPAGGLELGSTRLAQAAACIYVFVINKRPPEGAGKNPAPSL
jgi:hypothetical protein